MPAAYPTPAQLTTHFATFGATVTGTQAMLDTAQKEIHVRTGRVQFLGDTGDTTKRYTIERFQGERVVLEILDTYSVTAVLADYDGTSGTTLTEDDDYRLLPANYAAWAQPVEAIELINGFNTRFRSFAVTGKIGYAATVPQDIFDAILDEAARAYFMRSAGVSGQVSSEKQGDRSISYDAGQSTLMRLQNSVTDTIGQYIRNPYV